jgi:hypothetical protein
MNQEVPFAVFKYDNSSKYKELNPFKMDISSENKFKITAELNKNCFHLKDCL